MTRYPHNASASYIDALSTYSELQVIERAVLRSSGPCSEEYLTARDATTRAAEVLVWAREGSSGAYLVSRTEVTLPMSDAAHRRMFGTSEGAR